MRIEINDKSENADPAMNSTDPGIVIHFKLDEANALDSIRVNVDGDSNAIISNEIGRAHV
jgi:hypothetical protein